MLRRTDDRQVEDVDGPGVRELLGRPVSQEQRTVPLDGAPFTFGARMLAHLHRKKKQMDTERLPDTSTELPEATKAAMERLTGPNRIADEVQEPAKQKVAGTDLPTVEKFLVLLATPRRMWEEDVSASVIITDQGSTMINFMHEGVLVVSINKRFVVTVTPVYADVDA